jgi:translation initiation factor 4G
MRNRQSKGKVAPQNFEKLFEQVKAVNIDNAAGFRPDLVYAGNAAGFRPGPGGNYGVLTSPRVQTPIQYSGGILLGPSMGSQGGMPRNNPDYERWLRATIIQKGLIPSPHTPLLVMHKAQKKYEVGKVTDEEQAKQR